MIFSLEQCVAPAWGDLQNTCKTAGFLSLVCSGLHRFSSPVVLEWCQHPRIDLRLRIPCARVLESSVDGYPLISTLVPAPGSESMRNFAPSISLLPLMDRRPIILARSLLGRVEGMRMQSSLGVEPKYPGTIGKN
jgi:hypothetical protein